MHVVQMRGSLAGIRAALMLSRAWLERDGPNGDAQLAARRAGHRTHDEAPPDLQLPDDLARLVEPGAEEARQTRVAEGPALGLFQEARHLVQHVARSDSAFVMDRVPLPEDDTVDDADAPQADRAHRVGRARKGQV